MATSPNQAPKTDSTLAPPLRSPKPQLFRTVYESTVYLVFFLCSAASIIITVGILAIFAVEAFDFFREVSIVEFLTETEWSPTFAEDQRKFGILPLVCGTLWVTVGSGLVALPIGLFTAVYLSEFASPKIRVFLKPILEILAGIPSVVYGFFAIVLVSPVVVATSKYVFGDSVSVDAQNVVNASIVVGMMILPTVVSLSEEMLQSVPQKLREGGYALGSTRSEVTFKIVVPAALSGIVASFLLALCRALGETMAVTLAAGARPVLTLNPLKSVQTMTAFIVELSKGDAPVGSIEYRSIFAVGITLFLMTLVTNIIAQMILKQYREVYE